MREAYCQTFREAARTGIGIRFLTLRGGHHPPHWHEELELIYPLNGDTDIILEGERIKLLKRHLLVVESRKVHSIHALDKYSMFLSVHISKKEMEKYLPDIEMYRVQCLPEQVEEEAFHYYLVVCKLLEFLIKCYVEDSPTFQMEAEGLVLQTYSILLTHFAAYDAPLVPEADRMTMDRIRQVILYVEEHYAEQISLKDAADLLGVGKEYFCRFFKKNMNLSFLQYLNDVRISHMYQDLITTDLPIAEIMEKNGLMNQKLCNKSFKNLYGCTPSQVRKSRKEVVADRARI